MFGQTKVTYFDDVILSKENISSSKIPMNDPLVGKVLHTPGYLVTPGKEVLKRIIIITIILHNWHRAKHKGRGDATIKDLRLG